MKKNNHPHYPRKRGSSYSEHRPGFYYIDKNGKKHRLSVIQLKLEYSANFTIGDLEFNSPPKLSKLIKAESWDM